MTLADYCQPAIAASALTTTAAKPEPLGLAFQADHDATHRALWDVEVAVAALGDQCRRIVTVHEGLELDRELDALVSRLLRTQQDLQHRMTELDKETDSCL